MYNALDAYMEAFGPGLTVIAVLAATFAGNEIIRTEVRQFANLLNGLCKKHKSAILLLAHPSLAGMSTGTGLSGSTDWNNGFRSRVYLETINGKENGSYRVFKGMKNNYGELGGKIDLQWKNGLYVPVEETAGIEKVIINAKIEEKFMTSLKKRASQDRPVSDKPGPNYAPTVFAAEPEAIAEKITSKQFEAAMERLFTANQIRVETSGPPSRPRRSVVTAEQKEGAQSGSHID